MIVITEKEDLQDLWCMGIMSLGGKARKEEIVNWIQALKDDGLISIPHKWRGSWAIHLQHQKDHLKPDVIKKETKGRYHFWSLIN